MSILGRLLKTAPDSWTRDDLRNLSNNELIHISRLLGIPTSGIKDRKITRIITSVSIRTVIANWEAEKRFELVKQYTQKELKSFAHFAGTMHYGSKIQMITALIIWRDRSRQTGAAYTEEYKAAMAAQADRPRQTQLPDFENTNGSYTTVYTSWTSKTERSIKATSEQAEQLPLF